MAPYYTVELGSTYFVSESRSRNMTSKEGGEHDMSKILIQVIIAVSLLAVMLEVMSLIESK